MQDILQEIVAHKRREVERFKQLLPPDTLRSRVEAMLEFAVPSMTHALQLSETGIIAEFKRRSPSKGWIKEQGRAEDIPLAYQQAGAAALSILTDEHYFGGRDEFVTTARHTGVQIPILYKNFVIDPYQLLQARLCGASAVLLIAACLTPDECDTLLRSAHALGLEVLLEMHDEQELQYAELHPDLCGINNRHLGTFETDVQTSYHLARQLRDHCAHSSRPPVLVSESGISSPQTVRELRDAGFRGFLIGETFMRTPDPAATLRQFIDDIT